MKKYNYRTSIKTVFNVIVILTVFFLTQTGQASEEFLQGKKVNCDYDELLEIVDISNDRIRFLEKEQSKIPRLVKSAIDNILATVIERKVKGLEGELKSELRTLETDLEAEFGVQLGTLEVDVSERIKIVEENTGEALINLSESLKDEITVQFLGRDMKIATSLSELKKELKKRDKEVTASQAASNNNYLKGKETALKSEESLVYGYQESPQEESKNNLLLISQMFEYLDEKDREIASLSERLKSLEAFAVGSMNPIKASQNRMME